MAQTLGLISVIWRGANVPVEKGGKVTLGGLQQKEVIVGQQVDYANEMVASQVQATSRLKRGDSLLSLYAPGTGELQVQCDTGQTYLWPAAFLSTMPTFTGSDGGKLNLEWRAGAPEELLNG